MGCGEDAGTSANPGGADVPPRHMLLAHAPFRAENLTAVRHRLARLIQAVGGSGGAGQDFVLAVYELMTNAVRHGGGRGTLRLVCRGDTLTCEVADHGGNGGRPPVTAPSADKPGGRGVWLARHLSDALTLTQRGDGISAVVTLLLPPVPTGGSPPPAVDRAGVTLPTEPSSRDTDDTSPCRHDRTEIRGGRRTVVLSGELDMSDVPDVQEMLHSAVESACAVDVDLADVTFIDSTVISTLIAARQAAAAAGKRFTAVEPTGHVHLLAATGVLDTLPGDTAA